MNYVKKCLKKQEIYIIFLLAGEILLIILLFLGISDIEIIEVKNLFLFANFISTFLVLLAILTLKPQTIKARKITVSI